MAIKIPILIWFLCGRSCYGENYSEYFDNNSEPFIC